MAQPARMSDVAKLARVSTMTVSRVLNNNPNVLEETRQRVHLAVEQLSYQRNELARSLREKRSRQIGILVPNLYDPFFALCAHVISGVAKEHGYSVNIATSDEDSAAEFSEANRMLLRHVEGLAVIPAAVVSGGSRLLGSELDGLPIVSLDRPLHGDGKRNDAVLVENREGARRGTEHLLRLGYSRITFVGLERRPFTLVKRQEGYAAAMKARGLKGQCLFVSGELEATMEEIRRMLQGPEPPQAVFSGNNLLTRQVLHSLQALNVHPPEQVALVGFDDFETADLLRPGITVVREPTVALARQAAELLFERIHAGGSSSVGKHIVLPVELVVRGSCGAKVRA